MRAFIHFLIFCVIAIFLLILLQSRVFSFYTVNPNTIIAFFSVLVASKVRQPFVFGLFLLLCVFSFYFYHAWLIEYVFIVFSAIFMIIVRRFLFGNMIGDICMLAFLGTAVFSILNMLFTGSLFSPLSFFYELIFNCISGLIIYGVLRSYIKRSRTTNV